MNIIFKRKSKSVPNIKKAIYSKIENLSLRQQWKTFLKNELQLTTILHELSKAQFDIRNQDKFKYTARSILMMKRQVIRYIQQNQLEQGKKKLKQLHTKINNTQMKKIQMMIIFLQSREQLEKSISSSKQENIISSLKLKMNENIAGNQISLIKIKILTILSILLLRFHGILMSAQEKHIIYKTIQLKKKKMLQMDVREQRQAEFQCLLYLLLELYKILYLLKKDQQTILFYYNQLHAYTQIYITRQQNKIYLDIHELNRILSNMKPALNQLDIYEDSKLRKNLAFAHIQEEIIQQENQSGKMQSIKKQQQKKVRVSSSMKITSSKRLHHNVRNDRRLTINYNSSNNKNIPAEQTIENVLQIESNPINYHFLIVSQERLFNVNVKFVFRNGCNLFDTQLRITSGYFIQIYRINGMSLAVEKLSFRAISRFLQKVVNFLFESQYYFRQMHNLYFSDDFLPKYINVQNILASMARIKTQIGQYLRQNNSTISILGPKFNMPLITLEEIMTKFDKQLNEAKLKDKLMVQRRQGFILNEKYQVKVNKQICTKMIIKRQHQNMYQYYLFNIFFEQYFKGIQIYYFYDQETLDLNQYINSLKRISKFNILNHRVPIRKNIILSMLALQNKIQRPIPIINIFKVQQELQINQQKLQPKMIKIKLFKKHKLKEKEKKCKTYQLVKTEKTKYYLFVKQIQNGYIIYKNDMVKLFLPLNWREYSWNLTKKRFRMYEGIKILNRKQNSDYFVKTYKQEQQLLIKQQLMMIKFERHKVIRKRNGYCMLLEYQTNQSQYLYEIILNKLQRYYFLSISPITGWHSIISQASIIKKYPFQLYQGIRQKISQANWYYMHVIKCKNKKMASRKYLTL